jgi:argonaute-like protein implicated in RNA metabolism and viral defense
LVRLAYPCERELFFPLDGRNVLLWTQGNAPRAALDGKNFYKEGKGIPEPLQLKRFAGHGAWNPSCEAILSLSKMNWNNDSLYDRLPVTMAYAQILARVIKRMPRLLSDTYKFRFFM